MLRTMTLSVVAGLALAGAAAAQTNGTFLNPSPDQPTTRVGTRGANFLEIGVGARAQALGNAGGGLISGVTAMYWNPAGIGSTDQVSAAFSRSDLYRGLGITHAYFGVVFPVLGGGLGINYTRLDGGDIPRTDEEHPDGSGTQFGTVFSWSGTAVGIAYGRRLTDRLSVGGGAKVISEGIDNAQAQWLGFDIGTQFNTGLAGFSIGAAMTNAGGSARFGGPLIERRVNAQDAFTLALPVQFATIAHALPTAFHFSVVSNLAGSPDALLRQGGLHKLQAIIEFNDGVDTDLMTTLAAEYSYNNLLFLRAGKRLVNEQRTDFRASSFGLAWGGGLRLPIFGRHVSMDYAHTNMGELQNVQTFTFEIGN
jgi:hypothetical protein